MNYNELLFLLPVDPDGEEDPCAELERNVRSILNKLTPQKFDKLVKQFNELKIDSEKKLANSIELIFEKVSTDFLFKKLN